MKRLNWILPAAILTTILFLGSCTDDNSADPVVDMTGSWLCKETVAGSSPNTFTISVQKHNGDTLFVSNFNNLGNSTHAIWLVAGSSITIPSQNITQTIISGSGFYNTNTNKISLTYVSDGENVTAECTH